MIFTAKTITEALRNVRCSRLHRNRLGYLIYKQHGCTDPNCGCAALTTGACCHPDGSCTMTTPAGCVSPNVFKGLGTVCSPNPCVPTGACCHPDGTCSLTTQAACVSPNVWQGAATVCDPNPCAPTGVCCLPDGSCTETTETACVAAGGNYVGDGTECSEYTCNCGGTCFGKPTPKHILVTLNGNSKCGQCNLDYPPYRANQWVFDVTDSILFTGNCGSYSAPSPGTVTHKFYQCEPPCLCACTSEFYYAQAVYIANATFLGTSFLEVGLSGNLWFAGNAPPDFSWCNLPVTILNKNLSCADGIGYGGSATIEEA